jgi:hypothetical protein
LVTDESDLFDFADVTGDREQEVQRMLVRMGATYGIDPSYIQSTKITDLLEFLSVYEAGKVPHTKVPRSFAGRGWGVISTTETSAGELSTCRRTRRCTRLAEGYHGRQRVNANPRPGKRDSTPEPMGSRRIRSRTL